MGVIKMISAKEAYIMAKKNDKTMELQLKEIEDEILKAVENGDFSLKWERPLSENVKRCMRYLGYDVSEYIHTNNTNDRFSHYWIQWA